MNSNQEYKNRALADLEGMWSKAVVATLIFFCISDGVGYILSFLTDDNDSLGNGLRGGWEMLCLPLTWGFGVYFLNLIRREDVSYGRLFDGYRDFRRVFVAVLLSVVAVVVGLVLLVVPGIIVALMLSQTFYIMKDDSQTSAVEAMRKSMKMMEGHKMGLLGLALSFIGWFLLCLLTVGIGFLLLIPYFETTTAHYYEDLKALQGETDG